MNIPEPTALEQLYYDFNNETKPGSAESWEALDKCREKFARQNPNSTIEAQNSADDAVIAYGEIHRREGFIDGFKYAVKLMGEVYARGGAGE